MLELDRETHQYSNWLPAVSDIMEAAGLVDKTFFTKESRERGTMLHLVCEYYDQGDLDEDSVDPAIAGYFEAYKNWRKLSGLTEKREWIEIPVSDKAHTYAGTPDRVILRRPRSIVDLKTGSYLKHHPIQLAAYVNCLDDPFSYSRFGLYLKDNGKFSVREFPKSEYMADLAIFQSALNIYYWKERK